MRLNDDEIHLLLCYDRNDFEITQIIKNIRNLFYVDIILQLAVLLVNKQFEEPE